VIQTDGPWGARESVKRRLNTTGCRDGVDGGNWPRSWGRFGVGAELALGARAAVWRFHTEESLGVVQLDALAVEPAIDVPLVSVSSRIRVSVCRRVCAGRAMPNMRESSTLDVVRGRLGGHLTGRARDDQQHRGREEQQSLCHRYPPRMLLVSIDDESRSSGQSCPDYIDVRLSQNGQFPGFGASVRSGLPGGTKYVTTLVAGAVVSLRAMCACAPVSRNPCPA
jgi:hypothetical protein